MKQEDKELLLKDLCARLPYGVIVEDRNGVHRLTSGNTEFVDLFNGKCNIKPYLFPLLSMTDEQEKECQQIKHSYYYDDDSFVLFDWYNKNHFDYRGLISMGLAIDATNKNIY